MGTSFRPPSINEAAHWTLIEQHGQQKPCGPCSAVLPGLGHRAAVVPPAYMEVHDAPIHVAWASPSSVCLPPLAGPLCGLPSGECLLGRLCKMRLRYIRCILSGINHPICGSEQRSKASSCRP